MPTLDANNDAPATEPADAVGAMPDARLAEVGTTDATSNGGRLARCSGSGDVYFEDVSGIVGVLPTEGPKTYTDRDSTWRVTAQPVLTVDVRASLGPVVFLQITNQGSPLTPGTYPQGPSTARPSLQIAVAGGQCTIASGELAVVDAQYRPGGQLGSLALWFDLVCAPGPDFTGPDSLRGCLRYAM
jgi:hypothetical protein